MEGTTKNPLPLLLLLLVIGLAAATMSGSSPLPSHSFLAAVTTVDADCNRIDEGTLRSDDGNLLWPGTDQWGYDYANHYFAGDACDASRGNEDCTRSALKLRMKWNDAYLSNSDCNGDGLLDRHAGFSSYRGSGAEVTNLLSGSYTDEHRTCEWSYEATAHAVPETAYLTVEGSSTIWVTQDGTELGPQVWDEFAIIHERYADSCGPSDSLVEYISPIYLPR
jgi:hypothetical protein